MEKQENKLSSSDTNAILELNFTFNYVANNNLLMSNLQFLKCEKFKKKLLKTFDESETWIVF